MKRVIVIGCPGAGKSTFSRRLRDVAGLPLHHLDMILHRPDRTRLPREEFDAVLEELLAGPCWILDGNYRRTMERRMAACDTVFLLDYPVGVCLAGAEERVGRIYGDMPWKGTLDVEFRQRILDFADSQRPYIYELLERFGGSRRIVVFKSREEAELFLTRLAEERPPANGA